MVVVIEDTLRMAIVMMMLMIMMMMLMMMKMKMKMTVMLVTHGSVVSLQALPHYSFSTPTQIGNTCETHSTTQYQLLPHRIPASTT